MLPPPPPEIAALLARPVAILGAGVSGAGVEGLVAALGGSAVLYDERIAEAEPEFTAAAAATHGLVVFSPGFPPGHPWLARARAAGCTCLGELDFAALFWRGELVAVTGTNGKTTLTEFLAHALNAAGRRACATGNIGYPFSRLVVEKAGVADIAVCEVSSFQAETLSHFRPDAVLWTNFAEDHLERHEDLEAYFAAKWRLVAAARPGAVFVGTSVQAFAAQSGRALPEGSGVATLGRSPDFRLLDSAFIGYPQYENFLLAAAWWRHAGLPEEALVSTARSFRVGAHRLERVGERQGVTYWNDSKATNFHAVEAALHNFPIPVLWIGGGKSKGGDLAAFAGRIATRLRHAFLIGETGPVLADHLAQLRVAATRCGSLAESVRGAAAIARPGDHVLLSPGFASFDMFRGYDDRGKQFRQLVENL